MVKMVIENLVKMWFKIMTFYSSDGQISNHKSAMKLWHSIQILLITVTVTLLTSLMLTVMWHMSLNMTLWNLRNYCQVTIVVTNYQYNGNP